MFMAMAKRYAADAEKGTNQTISGLFLEKWLKPSSESGLDWLIVFQIV